MTERNLSSNSTETADDYSETVSPLPYIDTPPPPVAEPDQVIPQISSEPTPSSKKQTEINDLITKYSLGRIRKEYASNFSTNIMDGIASCVLSLLGLALTIIFWINLGLGSKWLILVSLSLFGIGVARITKSFNNIFLNTAYRNQHFYICTQGVLLTSKKNVQAIHWEDIQAVQTVFSQDNLHIMQYLLYPSNEQEPLILEKLFARNKSLRSWIEEEVTKRLLSKHIEWFQSGETLNFGAITISATGIHLEKEQKSLPWERFPMLHQQQGLLCINEKNVQSTWAAVEISDILNLFILFPLVKQINNQHRTKLNNQQPLSYQPVIEPAVQPSEWNEYEV